jgi:hypothetical protein
MECIKWFVHAIVAICSQGIWKNLVEMDIENQLKINVERGFPSIFANLDSMYYKQKKYPIEWQGQFQNNNG